MRLRRSASVRSEGRADGAVEAQPSLRAARPRKNQSRSARRGTDQPHTRSRIVVIPIPPPMHSVTRPVVLS